VCLHGGDRSSCKLRLRRATTPGRNGRRVRATAPPFANALCQAIVSAVQEPWAASLASRWPPAFLTEILPPMVDRPVLAEGIAASLRDLIAQSPVRPPRVSQSIHLQYGRRDVLLFFGDGVLSPYAVARFLNAIGYSSPPIR